MDHVANDISEITRRAIIDLLAESGNSWSGCLDEDTFLGRLYDLSRLPSTDRRFPNAGGDIHQHRVNNHDWDKDWVFYDSRFNVLHADDDVFLKFLCETVHPVPRPRSDEAFALVQAYNDQLRRDGWEIFKAKEISGRPVFSFQRCGTRAVVFEEPTGWQKVDRQLREMQSRLDDAGTEEQFQAVGLLCREVLISVAQEVYDPTFHGQTDGPAVSDTDVKRMLDAIFEVELRGSANEEARAHAKAAVRLALALQHKRTADFRTAGLCSEGTWSVVNMLAIICGRRGRPFS